MTLTVSDFLRGVKTSASATLASLGIHANVYVSAQGPTASVMWDEIGHGSYRVQLNMPAMPLDSVLSRQDADSLVAYWIHEIGGHVAHTNLESWHKACAKGETFARIVNALEDVRIEKVLK